MAASRPPTLTFRRAQRLTLARDFQRAYAARTSVVRGPLRVHAAPNSLSRARLGLSVPKRVGTNVKRNLLKRLLREAFRLQQQHLPVGLDLVIGVQPHTPLPLADYQDHLRSAARALASTWRARGIALPPDMPADTPPKPTP